MRLILIPCFFMLVNVLNHNISEKKIKADNPKLNQAKQLNIHILLDLSDRIDTSLHPAKPEHYKRDIQIINDLTKFFVDDVAKRGAYLAKGKIQISFYPRPDDPNINTLADKLSVNMAEMDVRQKRDIYDHLTERFTDNVAKIYRTAILQHKWAGSDIWRFFKNDVKDYCIEKDGNYRNILIILTDGYIYHEDSKRVLGNRYAYILPRLLIEKKLRKNPNWKSQMDKLDFGLITTRNDLQNLEVLLLEITPSKDHKDDEDILKSIWEKWFVEMRVKRFGIYNTDLPASTKKRVLDFLQY